MISTEPVILEGAIVRLQPMTRGHLPALIAAAGRDPSIFSWYADRMDTPEAIETWVERCLSLNAQGTALPLVTIDRRTDRLIGASCFLHIDRRHKRAEIGATWLVREAQRTGANREAKLLMLTHAFEAWGCQRVEFKTDSLNAQSRQAMRRLGLVEEGILRNHMLVHDGRHRHSVFFSAIVEEWPALKASILDRQRVAA